MPVGPLQSRDMDARASLSSWEELQYFFRTPAFATRLCARMPRWGKFVVHQSQRPLAKYARFAFDHRIRWKKWPPGRRVSRKIGEFEQLLPECGTLQVANRDELRHIIVMVDWAAMLFTGPPVRACGSDVDRMARFIRSSWNRNSDQTAVDWSSGLSEM